MKYFLVFVPFILLSCQITHPTEKDLIGTWYAEDNIEHIELCADGKAIVSCPIYNSYFLKIQENGGYVTWKLDSIHEDYGTDYQIQLCAEHRSYSVSVRWSILNWNYYFIEMGEFEEIIMMYRRE